MGAAPYRKGQVLHSVSAAAPEFTTKQGSGVRGTDRILNVIPFAKAHFQR
jgi:hypothetical protein